MMITTCNVCMCTPCGCDGISFTIPCEGSLKQEMTIREIENGFIVTSWNGKEYVFLDLEGVASFIEQGAK